MWTFVSGWTFEPLLAAGIIVAAVLYGLGLRRVTRATPAHRWPVKYTVAYYFGIAAMTVALLGPFGRWDRVMFWAHMTQHIVIMMIAVPLMLLGQPVLLILRTVSPHTRTTYVVPFLRSRVVRFFTHPAVSWVIFGSVLFIVHFTGFYNYALGHLWVHTYVEHAMYVFAAVVYFYPLLGIGPHVKPIDPPMKVASLFLMMLPESMVGFAIWSAGHVLFPHYDTVTDRVWGPGTALLDQRLGGSLMWSSSMIVGVVWILYAAWQWMKAEEVKSKRVDREIAAEIARGEA